MSKIVSIEWTSKEEKLLRSLGKPERIQNFLDAIPYRCEDWHPPAIAALRDRTAHCFDGALLAAAAFKRSGVRSALVDLCAIRDDDHLLCAYYWKGRIGAVAKSNFPGLRFREPVFKNVRELVLSYFDLFCNLKGEKTLRQYSAPVRLPAISKINWETNEADTEKLVEVIAGSRHYKVLKRGQERLLSPMDERSFKSQTMGVNRKGAYKA